MAALRRHFPEAELRLRRTRLSWTADVQPTPCSRIYRVRVSYELGKRPRAHVLTPLAKRKGARCEHMYADDEPCLYRPHAREWTPDMLIATTVVPWLSEWLAHYEVWLAVGEWQGGGEHPDVGTSLAERLRERGLDRLADLLG